VARVLVIDDEALVRKSIERVLRKDGHDVVLAAHGHEGLHFATERSFDVAIVDFKMPIIDGVEVLQRMRELQPHCARILVTARLDLNAIVGAVNRGEVSRVIEKPFDSRGLVAEVNAVLDNRRRLAEAARQQDEDQARAQRVALCTLLQGDHLRLALQPIVAAADGQILAYECLMRSSLPALPHPGAVLAAAEQHDMLEEVSEVVVQRAADWLAVLPAGVQLFINLHPDELSDADSIAARLQRLRPWADRVVLEITDHLTIIGGDNRQGKSTILDGIAWALGGNKYKPTDFLREGADKLTDKVTLSNGWIVERYGKNGSLRVVTRDGAMVGQKEIDEFKAQREARIVVAPPLDAIELLGDHVAGAAHAALEERRLFGDRQHDASIAGGFSGGVCGSFDRGVCSRLCTDQVTKAAWRLEAAHCRCSRETLRTPRTRSMRAMRRASSLIEPTASVASTWAFVAPMVATDAARMFTFCSATTCVISERRPVRSIASMRIVTG
jgi:CheY-like chemotaxis protein